MPVYQGKQRNQARDQRNRAWLRPWYTMVFLEPDTADTLPERVALRELVAQYQ